MEEDCTRPHTTRRTVLLGAGSAGVVAVLAACGKNSSPGDGPGGTGGPTVSNDLGKTSAIPVGGGVIFDQQNVVVTQPASGTFKAFTATCTHAGCQVASVDNGMIICPCHGSTYSIVDGSVKQGPAPKALGAAQINVANGEIRLA